jgi:5-methylcytosine-specific restriction protein A
LYSKNRWRKLAKAQLRREPLCCICLAAGRVTPATIADHVIDHRGDYNAFIIGGLQSLCASCHNGRKRLEVARGFQVDIGPDGFPTDPRHPIYRMRT